MSILTKTFRFAPTSLMRAAIVVVVVTSLVAGLSFVSQRTIGTLDWTLYGAWLQRIAPVRVSPSLVLVTRDEASEARFGSGPWDRRVLARAIRGLSQAGAVAVGLDVRVGEPSPPQRGGAASDAELIEAIAETGRVVYPLSLTWAFDAEGGQDGPMSRGVDLADPAGPGLLTADHDGLERVVTYKEALPGAARYAKGVGHDLALEGHDGSDAGETPAAPTTVLRRIPLMVLLEDRAVPAIGLALAQAFHSVPPSSMKVHTSRSLVELQVGGSEGPLHDLTIPFDRKGGVLVPVRSGLLTRTDVSIPFTRLMDAIEYGRSERLRQWVEGKAVVILASDGIRIQGGLGTPTITAAELHVHLFNALLTEQWLEEIPQSLALPISALLSGLGAWLILSLPGWRGPAGVSAVGLGYLVTSLWALSAGGIIVPLFTPLLALFLGSGGSALWLTLGAGRRIGALEGHVRGAQRDLASVRVALHEALLGGDAAVQSLEQDLEAARAEVHRSLTKEADLVHTVADLQGFYSDSKLREEATGERVLELERRLEGLKAVSGGGKGFGDAEQERLRLECERVGVLTRDRKVLALFKDLEKAAQTSLPVLLLGEPGTGKEIFARALHGLSPRAQHPFVAVNMAAISPGLVESELFGHVKGSFTGAQGDRKGYFELAHQGTLFLDEIGDLPHDHQGKLLRALEDKTFYRVGAAAPTRVDVRVVAATNKDLPREVDDGWFREDLYFRLKGLVLHLPPLRERHQDLPLLAQHFVREAARQAGRSGLSLSREALSLLEVQPWKGNVRELQQCLLQAVALAEGDIITKEDLRLARSQPASSLAVSHRPGPGIEGENDQSVLACLRLHEFDVQATARALGWDRGTVTQRLKGLGFRALVDSRGDRLRAALTVAGDPALARRVEMKLHEYYSHLLRTIDSYDSAGSAIAACRRRFKNLPARYFDSVEQLIHQYFEQSGRHRPIGTQ